MQQTQLIIAGGGLAGLTAGIHMALQGFAVILIEKNIIKNIMNIYMML